MPFRKFYERRRNSSAKLVKKRHENAERYSAQALPNAVAAAVAKQGNDREFVAALEMAVETAYNIVSDGGSIVYPYGDSIATFIANEIMDLGGPGGLQDLGKRIRQAGTELTEVVESIKKLQGVAAPVSRRGHLASVKKTVQEAYSTASFGGSIKDVEGDSIAGFIANEFAEVRDPKDVSVFQGRIGQASVELQRVAEILDEITRQLKPQKTQTREDLER